MNRLKAYIVWLYRVCPKIKIERIGTCKTKLGRKVSLKLLLKKYCGQSSNITPWPYKKTK